MADMLAANPNEDLYDFFFQGNSIDSMLTDVDPQNNDLINFEVQQNQQNNDLNNFADLINIPDADLLITDDFFTDTSSPIYDIGQSPGLESSPHSSPFSSPFTNTESNQQQQNVPTIQLTQTSSQLSFYPAQSSTLATYSSTFPQPPSVPTFQNTPIDYHPNSLSIKSEVPITTSSSTSSSTSTKKPTKKRRRTSKKENSAQESKFPAHITLSRDAILTWSCAQMDSYIQQLKSTQKLTKEEERELKRQRRLIYNREYAQQHRVDNKNLVVELKIKVDHLAKLNSDLQGEVMILNNKIATISTENTQLRLQLAQVETNSAHKRIGNISGRTSTAAAGACLLAVLFFGVFFNFGLGGGGLWGIGGGGVGGDGREWKSNRVLLEDGGRGRIPEIGVERNGKDVQDAVGEVVKCDFREVCHVVREGEASPETGGSARRDVSVENSIGVANGTSTTLKEGCAEEQR